MEISSINSSQKLMATEVNGSGNSVSEFVKNMSNLQLKVHDELEKLLYKTPMTKEVLKEIHGLESLDNYVSQAIVVGLAAEKNSQTGFNQSQLKQLDNLELDIHNVAIHNLPAPGKNENTLEQLCGDAMVLLMNAPTNQS